MRNNNENGIRILILNLCIILGGLILIIQLFNLQIVQGESYRLKAQNRVLRQVVVNAPRGEILDRHGDILATNRDGYNVLLYKQDLTTDERNDFILRLVNLLINREVVYRDTFPILIEENNLFFTFDDEAEEKKWKKRYYA